MPLRVAFPERENAMVGVAVYRAGASSVKSRAKPRVAFLLHPFSALCLTETSTLKLPFPPLPRFRVSAKGGKGSQAGHCYSPGERLHSTR